jgi:hypothetical protein
MSGWAFGGVGVHLSIGFGVLYYSHTYIESSIL